MIDLRRLSKKERESLKNEAARRAKAGQSPREICRTLGIKPQRYAVWARHEGFKTIDPDPSASAGVDKSHSKGDLDLTGPARAVLVHVRTALETGDRAKADRIVAAWAAQRRRDKGLSALEAEAAREQDIANNQIGLSDAELVAKVSALIGRRVSLRAEPDEKS